MIGHLKTSVNILMLLGTAAIAAPGACDAQSATTFALMKDTMALTPDLHSGEHIYLQYCSACHKRSGWGSGPREVPTLAGQEEFYLLEQLLQFSVFERVKEEMHAVVARPQIARPQALRDVSAYIARQPRNPDPDRGDGTHLRAGERIYRESCATCHGKVGEASPADLIPAVGGQQYGYLLVQLHNIAKGHRKNLPPAIIDFVAALPPAGIESVADYMSRLPALKITASSGSQTEKARSD
jgi:cytochrome c553